MADEPDPERLRALEARLARAVPKPKPVAPPAGKAFSQGEMAWRMVLELVSGMLLGLSIGYGLDWLSGTGPLFLAIFSLLGFAAGVRTMLRTAKTMTAPDRGAAPADDAKG